MWALDDSYKPKVKQIKNKCFMGKKKKYTVKKSADGLSAPSADYIIFFYKALTLFQLFAKVSSRVSRSMGFDTWAFIPTDKTC